MKLRLIILSLVFSCSAMAQECSPSLSLEQFNQILLETKEAYFSELANISIELKTFQSQAYFLEVAPVTKTLVSGSREGRSYRMRVNQKLLACPPLKGSLQAILVHELEHIRDFSGWSTVKLAKHAIRYSLSFKFRSRYERSTDQKVLEKGLGPGLAGYRNWVYQWLSPKDLELKRSIYLTPEEILGGSIF